MSRAPNPFILHTLLGLVLLVGLQILLPEGTAWWRRIIVGILAVSFGFDLAKSLLAFRRGTVQGVAAAFESLAFPLLMAGIFLMPKREGWVFLATAFVWRPLKKFLFRPQAPRT